MTKVVDKFIQDKLKNSEISFKEKCAFVREVLTDDVAEASQKALAYKTLILSQKLGDVVPEDIIKMATKLTTKAEEEFHANMVTEKKSRPISKSAILSIWLVRNKEMEAWVLAARTGVPESQATTTLEELVTDGSVKKRVVNVQGAQGAIRTTTWYSLTTEEEKRIMAEKIKEELVEQGEDEAVLDEATITEEQVADLVAEIAKKGKKKTSAKPKEVETVMSDDDLIDALVKKAETKETAGMKEAKELAKKIEGTSGEKDSIASRKKVKNKVEIDVEKKKITPVKVAKPAKKSNLPIKVSTKIVPTEEDKKNFKDMADKISGQKLVFSETPNRVSAKCTSDMGDKLMVSNLFTLLYDRPIPIIVMNKIKAAELPETMPVKSWNDYASIVFTDPNREKIMKEYIKKITTRDK